MSVRFQGNLCLLSGTKKTEELALELILLLAEKQKRLKSFAKMFTKMCDRNKISFYIFPPIWGVRG